MYCKHCGAQLPQNEKVCPRCGAAWEKEATEATAPVFFTQEFAAVTETPPAAGKRRRSGRLVLLTVLLFAATAALGLTAQLRLTADGALPLYVGPTPGEAVESGETGDSKPVEPDVQGEPESTASLEPASSGSSAGSDAPEAPDPSSAPELPPESLPQDSSAPETSSQPPAEAADPRSPQALAAGLSPEGVTSQPHQDPVLTAAGAAPLEKATVCIVSVDTPSLRLRAQPNTSSEVLDQLWNTSSRFYCLYQQDGWAYGVYLGQMGWCSLDYLTPAAEQPLPAFLSAGEQCRYLQALSLYDGCAAVSSPGLVREDALEINGQRYCHCRGFGGSYDRLCAVLGDVFVSQTALDVFLNGSFYPVEDRLYELETRSGAAAQLQYTQFRLDGRSDDRVVFTQQATCVDAAGQTYTAERPVVLSRAADGVWRCEVITSALYGDLLAGQ